MHLDVCHVLTQTGEYNVTLSDVTLSVHPHRAS
jgi:hypothetical protein